MENLPVFDPWLTGFEEKWIQKALSERSISGTSPIIGEFESRLAARFNRKHAVAVSNGTVALHVAAEALKLAPGDEVIIPDFTIISNALAVVLCRATPVFVDVRPDNWCIDISRIEAAITPRTVGIMAVHMYGQACDLTALQALCEKHRLWLMEDAAQGQGGAWEGRPLGSFGEVSCLSFYANKLITTGEGGAVLTDDPAIADRLRTCRNLGFDPHPQKRFIHAELANNYRMSGLQAAMGIGQLEGWDALNRERERVRAEYAIHLDPQRGYRLPSPDPRSKPAFWMCALQLEKGVRVSVPQLQTVLRQKGIETRRFFYPLHCQPALNGHHTSAPESFPVSNALFEHGLYLPSSSHLQSPQIAHIVETLHQAIQ